MIEATPEKDPFAPVQNTSLMPLRTALDLRTLSESVLGQFHEFTVGTPETGPVHRDLTIEHGDYPAVKVDIVQPRDPGPSPVMVYLHGGGWVSGDLDVYHQLVRRFAEQGFVVVAVDYGLAPEKPFPLGYNDCVAAIEWAIENIADYGGDANRIVVAGDSAGANLAAGIAVSEPGLPIRAVGLFYGVYDLEHMPTSPESHAEGFLDDLHRTYLGADNLHLLTDPRVGPIHAADRMPPAFIAVGADDAGVSESGNLARALEKAGVEHRYVVVEDHPHGFLQLEMLPKTLSMVREISAYLEERASA